jgi:hypothetical protein
MDSKTNQPIDKGVVSSPLSAQVLIPELRAWAAEFIEPNAQIWMLRIASDYERLAELVRYLPFNITQDDK